VIILMKEKKETAFKKEIAAWLGTEPELICLLEQSMP
jgi:hypothetical protein